MPEAAITTDIIVGFPGETEADFQGTLDVVAAARFAGAFTFQYSIRAGTPAATMPDQVPKAVVQERYERLVTLVEEIAWRENQTQVGRTVEVMFAAGEGRKDAATARMSGRARDNRLVHVAVPDDPADAAPPRRHRRDRDHLRRTPPPERRRRPRQPPPHPRRRRLGDHPVPSQPPPRRQPRPPVHRPPCPAPTPARLRSQLDKPTSRHSRFSEPSLIDGGKRSRGSCGAARDRMRG